MTVRHTLGCAILAAALLAGPARAQDAPPVEGGSTLMNILRYGSSTPPPVAPEALDEAYCPSIDVIEGGVSMAAAGGRGQITLGQVARECTPRRDGSVSVKLGIQGRALLGPGGAAGRFEAPVYMALKRNGAVIASRVKRVPVAIPAGAAQGSFTFVEDGLIVPATAARDYDIEVGLGAGPRAAKPPRTRKPAEPQPG